MRKNLKYYNTNKRDKSSFIFVVCTVVIVVFVVVLVVFLSGKSNSNTTAKSFNTQKYVTETESMTETEVAIKTKPVTEMSTETKKNVYQERENSEIFDFLIKEANYNEGDFNCQQLIIVDSYDISATVNCFEKKDGVWEDVPNLTDISGYVGVQGVSSYANEYESYTPKGLFGIGTGFGICDDPGTGLDYFKITQDSYWVNDVNSVYYNQHVEGIQNKDWSSAEHLIDYMGNYNYCVFIKYNSNPPVPEKGSAFFLHVGSSPTAGCVAISEDYMIEVLKWLQKDKSPAILIY